MQFLTSWSQTHFPPGLYIIFSYDVVFPCVNGKINKNFSTYTPNMDVTYCKVTCNLYCDLYCSHSFLLALRFGLIKTWRLPIPEIRRLLQLVLNDEQLCAVFPCLVGLLVVLCDIFIQQIFIKHLCVSRDVRNGMRKIGTSPFPEFASLTEETGIK